MSEFHRLHPATPLLRGWKWLAVAVAAVGQDAIRAGDVRQLSITAVTIVVLGVFVGLASWWFTRYGIDGGDLRIDSGILFRRSRRVRLDRLQAVDVVRPLVGRALGVSELRLEVAGGGSTEAPLAYLSEADAQALRAELLARAAGLDAATPEAPERPLVAVPFSALALSTVLSPAFVIGVVAAVAIAASAAFTGQFAIVGPLLPALLGVGGAIYHQLVRNYGFTLSDSPDGLRIRKGLLDIRAQTVPPGRVQGVAVHHPLLWRGKGWVRVDVDVAGYGPDLQDGMSQSTLLPVAPEPLALEILARTLPGIELATVDLVPAPRRSRWLRPVGWRALAYGAGAEIFVTRHGRFHRVLSAVPHAKTQSVRLRQGPIQRRLGLASIHVDTPPGPVTAVAYHRDAGEARRIVDEQTERARRARRLAKPERWMISPGGQETGQVYPDGLHEPAEPAETLDRQEFDRPAGPAERG